MKRTQHIGKSTGKSKTKMKVYNVREAKQIVRKNGWILDRTAADHFLYKHPDNPKILTLCNKKLNRMIWERLVNEYDLKLNV